MIFSQVDYRAKVWSCNFCFQRNQVIYIVMCPSVCSLCYLLPVLYKHNVGDWNSVRCVLCDETRTPFCLWFCDSNSGWFGYRLQIDPLSKNSDFDIFLLTVLQQYQSLQCISARCSFTIIMHNTTYFVAKSVKLLNIVISCCAACLCYFVLNRHVWFGFICGVAVCSFLRSMPQYLNNTNLQNWFHSFLLWSTRSLYFFHCHV